MKFADAICKISLYGNKLIFPVPTIASSQKSSSEIGSLSLTFPCRCLYWQSYYIMCDFGTLFWVLHIDPSLYYPQKYCTHMGYKTTWHVQKYLTHWKRNYKIKYKQHCFLPAAPLCLDTSCYQSCLFIKICFITGAGWDYATLHFSVSITLQIILSQCYFHTAPSSSSIYTFKILSGKCCECRALCS